MAIKIFIDQGHNPVDPDAGVEVNGVKEQDINYEVGVRLARLLNNNPDFEARLSRNFPTTQLGTSVVTSLQARVYAANTWSADQFISLHCNFSDNTEISGSEAYVFDKNSAGYYMGVSILQGLHYMTELPNRGVFVDKNIYQLYATTMPAVLLEMGYLSNPTDLKLLTTEPQSFASGIYYGILYYYGLI